MLRWSTKAKNIGHLHYVRNWMYHSFGMIKIPKLLKFWNSKLRLAWLSSGVLELAKFTRPGQTDTMVIMSCEWNSQITLSFRHHKSLQSRPNGDSRRRTKPIRTTGSFTLFQRVLTTPRPMPWWLPKALSSSRCSNKPIWTFATKNPLKNTF